MRRRTVLGAAALVLALVVQSPAPSAQRQAPRLVVLIVVDQMRADYIDRFRGDWTGGLKRLVDQGAWFRRAAYPYLTTVTCAGHATISTGAFPHTHGIIQNAWWDRETGGPVTCTNDSAATPVSYGGEATGADSGHRLLVPTFADEMRAQRHAHVVTVSLKARSAIMLAGHGSDATLWLSDALDGWMSSSAFVDAPKPAVRAIIDRHPIDEDFGKTWTPLLDPSRYHERPDRTLGEGPPAGWTTALPHPLTSPSGRADGDYHTRWERSPYADAYLGRFAAALVDEFRLGRHDDPDVLGVSFSSPDLVGHAFGPDSVEIHDMYAQLDRTIGALLDHLDAAVGRGAYVVALSADHGVTPIPEDAAADGRDAGRINSAAIRSVLEARAQAAAGAGQYLSAVAGNDVYFAPGMYERLAAAPHGVESALEGLLSVPGVGAAFRADEVRGAASSSNRLLRAAALSYVPGRSGDLIFSPKPGWVAISSGTTHGSASEDDQRVPIVFYGAGIKHGAYESAATPADVTPTLASLVGLTLDHAEGHALRDALQK